MTCSNWNEALNIHQVSLNVTGSFVNGIICVVSSVGIAPIYGLLLAKKVLEIIRHLIAAEKLSFAYNNKVQQYFWHKYTFQRVPSQVENLRKFQGVGVGGRAMTSTPDEVWWKFKGGGGLWQAPPTVYNGNSRGMGGYDKHPLQCTMEIPGGWGRGYKVNVPFVGGMDISWKYTIINKMCFLQGSW